MKMPIDKCLDALYVQRWSLVGTDKESTVASHSFSVAMIAMEIRKRMYNKIGFSEQEVCYFALTHDIREVLTGDVPTPVKTTMREVGFDPERMYPEIPAEETPGTGIRHIVKAADLIDNYVFISTHGIGTRARVAAIEVGGRLTEFLAGASPDLARAAADTLAYIQERKSDDPEEGRRIKEASETARRVASFGPIPPVLDREPLHQPRSA